MGSYVVSLVSISAVNDKASSEALGVAVGHSGNEFGVPLTDDGLTITHYGLHSWTTLERETWWKGEAHPSDTGYSNAQIDAVRNKLIISTKDGATNPANHFNEVLTANGLALFEGAD